MVVIGRPMRVSIRVLVGIAQERGEKALNHFFNLCFNPCVGRNSSGASRRSRPATRLSSFNPCVGRNSSGAWPPTFFQVVVLRFQSVCWSE